MPGIWIQHLNVITASIRVNTPASFIKETDRERSLTVNKHLFLIRLPERRPKALCFARGYAALIGRRNAFGSEAPGEFKPLSRAESKPALIIHPMNKIFVKRRGNNRCTVKIGQARGCCAAPQMNQPASLAARGICRTQRRLWRSTDRAEVSARQLGVYRKSAGISHEALNTKHTADYAKIYIASMEIVGMACCSDILTSSFCLKRCTVSLCSVDSLYLKQRGSDSQLFALSASCS